MVVWSSALNDALDYNDNTIEEILLAMDKADLMYAQRINGKWTSPTILTRLPGSDEQMALAAGPDGRIAAGWINRTKNGSKIYSAFWDGKNWTGPVLVSQSVLNGSPKVIYVHENPLILWTQDSDGDVYTYDDWALYSSSWSGASWTSPRSLQLTSP